MNPLPPGLLKPMSREELDKLLLQYRGKEQGIGLEDVFTKEQIERFQNTLQISSEAGKPKN